MTNATLERPALEIPAPRPTLSRYWPEENPAPAVLVVEDDRHLSHALARCLRRSGFRVLAAHDGPSGVDLAIRETPDLVVLDLGLPGMHGMKVLRLMRSVPMTQEIPILILTGHFDPGLRSLPERWPAVKSVLFKPTPGRYLARRVAALLGRGPA